MNSFTFTIDNEKNELVVAPNKGNIFTPRTISLIQNATAGKMITIEKIIIDENGAEKELPGLIYKITN